MLSIQVDPPVLYSTVKEDRSSYKPIFSIPNYKIVALTSFKESPVMHTSHHDPLVLLYVTQTCPYCKRAQELLKKYGIPFSTIDVDQIDGAREEMLQRAEGHKTVPQIFIAGKRVGGCDDLYALDERVGLKTYIKQITKQ